MIHMRAHMTNGTWDFLERILKKRKINHYLLAHSETSSNTLAYYETFSRSRSPFAAGRSYEILIKSGTFEEEGYIVMNNIPLTEDGKPVFENRIKNKQPHLDTFYGYIAYRVLKPLKGNRYVILTQWESQEDYENWEERDGYRSFFDKETIQQPAYFASRPFKTYYSFFHEEEEDAEVDKEENEENSDEK